MRWHFPAMIGAAGAPVESGVLRRAGLAAGLAALWAAAALPLAFGWQRCAIATLFHVPCPGCGMTRALRLFAAGQVEASLRMNALAVPALAAGLGLALATVVTTYREGTLARAHRTSLGRAAIAAGVLVYGAAVALWIFRWLGWFGGPVAV